MCVCVCICVCACVHVFMCLCVWVCVVCCHGNVLRYFVCRCTHACAYVCAYACARVRTVCVVCCHGDVIRYFVCRCACVSSRAIHTPVCVCVCICVCVCACARVHVFVCVGVRVCVVRCQLLGLSLSLSLSLSLFSLSLSLSHALYIYACGELVSVRVILARWRMMAAYQRAHARFFARTTRVMRDAAHVAERFKYLLNYGCAWRSSIAASLISASRECLPLSPAAARPRSSRSPLACPPLHTRAGAMRM